MMRIAQSAFLSVLAFLTTTTAASAQSRGWWFWDWYYDRWGNGGSWGGSGNVSSVPEIDAGSGLLALAAVLAMLALAWELKRRRG